MMKLWEGDVMLVLLHLLDMFYCCPNTLMVPGGVLVMNRQTDIWDCDTIKRI